MTAPEHNYLFNFSSSFTGGGLIILESYLELFQNRGGAYFIVNEKLREKLDARFSKNTIFFVKIIKVKRFFDDQYYLNPILKILPRVKLYFSYGIPIYSKIGETNWLHISNLIPVNPSLSYLSYFSMAQMYLLGHRFKRNFKNVDVLSADSQDGVNQSLEFLGTHSCQTKVLKNGIESGFVKKKSTTKEPFAITVGTQKYKDLDKLYKLYLKLKISGVVKGLKIIGDTESIPSYLRNDKSVIIMGRLPHDEVIDELAQSQVYLSTSRIENSSIASLEGLYLCGSTYLSTIGSHKELIIDTGLNYETVHFEDLGRLYKVDQQVSESYIESISWENINNEFYSYLKQNY